MRKSLDIFNDICDQLLKIENSEPVAPYFSPHEIYDKLDLSLSDKSVNNDELQKCLTELVLHTPRTATNGFFNQLFGGRNDKAVLGDLLAVMLNNSMYTFKAGGPMVVIEKMIARKICDMLDWDQNSDGTIAPGGSMTNLKGMLMARDKFDPDIRYKGGKSGLVVYTSTASHYSIPKNAAFAGIGRDFVRFIETDEQDRMNAMALRKAIIEDKKAGLSPIMVNATAGTTVLGAFDPFIEIAAICAEYNIWMHVDGAYCGSCIFSDQYKRLIKGAEFADSFTLNAHKMLGTPLSCSIIVAKDKRRLYDSFSNDANYLYQTDQDEYNPGKISLQCGRRNDALKFWTLWKSVGTKGLAAAVDHQFHLADVARKYIRSNKDYTLFSFDDSISVCFNYKNIPARDICTALYKESKLLVGYGHFRNDEFIRLVTVNYQNEEADIIHFFKVLESFVAKYF